MCTVKKLTGKEKRVIIKLNSGKEFLSEWFIDESEKPENEVNSTAREKDTLKKMMKTHHFCEDDIDFWTISRKKEDNIVYISDHAFQRMKERNGWNKKTALRMVKKIYDNGQNMNDIKGSVAAWARGSVMSEESFADEIRVYGEYIYIFNKKTLITSYKIPTQSSLKRRIKAV